MIILTRPTENLNTHSSIKKIPTDAANAHLIKVNKTINELKMI